MAATEAASKRALRERIRSEDTYCVTLIDWRGALDAARILARFAAFFADTGRTPSVWLASCGADQQAISGASEVSKIIEQDAGACFELTQRHEREDFRGAWDVSCLFYDANNECEQTKGLSCLQVAASSRLVGDKAGVSESLARFVADNAEFSYGYAFTAPYGLDLEVYGPGLATSGSICPDLEDPYAWQEKLRHAMSARTARPHHDGRLRFVYPRNFLSEPLLRAQVGETDLAEWIVRERMGHLVKSANNLWTWDLSDAEMNAARLALGQRGILAAFRNRKLP